MGGSTTKRFRPEMTRRLSKSIHCAVLVGQRHDEVVDVGGLGRLRHRLLVRAGVAVQNVLEDRA